MLPATTTKAPPPAATKGPPRLLIMAVVAGCACVNIAFALWAVIARPAFNSDFRGPWSFANFARHRPVAEIYKATVLQAFQRQLYPDFRSFFPYQYPPSFLLPTWWMGDFSYQAAQTIWTGTGLALFIAAGWLFFKPSQRRFAILAMLAAPASLLNGAAGETAYFATAFLLFGFAMLPNRPVLAGVAFGLLTLKPQLGVLIPFALLARGEYRAIAAAGLTALAIIALSCAVFPAGLWLTWLHMLPVYQAQYFAAGKALNLNIVVTIAANLISLGASPGTAWTVQMLASLACIIAVIAVFRRGSYRLSVAALCTGTFLAAPHAYAYDTIPLTAAMVLLNPRSRPGIGLCIITYLAPLMLLTPASHYFLYALPETLLFIVIIRLALTPAPSPNYRHEPVPRPTPRLRAP